MKVYNILLQFIAVLLMMQLAFAGDEFIEDVDEAEQPEDLNGNTLLELTVKRMEKKEKPKKYLL